MSTRAERIEQALRAAFAPTVLQVADESHRHARHADRMDLPAGETHYAVTMVAESLRPLSRVERSRAVHEALAAEFKTGLHALSLSLSVP
ncbi:BolA family protein [Acidocella sp. KAb 2-4]|uniref:BolA family protein n=1 Tax=Acidocella sp. KAb 2-4 TaxID=2885158 RepID=UPI001D079991|nr:BolA family transcriptional regulator [Acidocella sp. KAb 2-4]